MLQKLDVDVSLTDDEEREYRYKQSVYTLVDSLKPTYLYKYRPCSTHAFEGLVKDELFLNTVSSFNDPTESMAYVDPDKLIDLVASIDNDNDIFENDKSQDLFHLSKRVDLMNDGLDYVTSIRDKLKIVCLSEVSDSALMWSHYADCHRGFAIRYKSDNFKMTECKACKKRDICWRPDKMLYPVIYNDKRFDASLIAFSKVIMMKTGLLNEIGWTEEEIPIPILSVLQKDTSWNYEKEWRVICKNMNINSIKVKPDAIFLGEKINCKDAVRLYKIAKEKNIPIHKMTINYFSSKFTLDYEDWSYYSVQDIKRQFD